MTYLYFSLSLEPVTGRSDSEERSISTNLPGRTFWLDLTLPHSLFTPVSHCSDRIVQIILCGGNNENKLTICLNCLLIYLLVRCSPAFDLHARRVPLSHTFPISTCRCRCRRHRRPSARSEGGGGHVSIPNMQPLTRLISREARRAHAGRISTQVLHHLLRGAERGRCEVNRGRLPTCCLAPVAIISLTGIRHCSRDARRGAGGDGGPPSNSGTRALFIFRGAGLCNCVEDAVCTGSGKKRKETWRTRLLCTRRQTLQLFDL